MVALAAILRGPIPMRILVVEDFAPLRESLVQGLRESGYAVDESGDGQDGLWHARSGEHDVIVLDIMLPKLDGLSVLKQLRQDHCPAMILLLTAKDTSEDKVRGLAVRLRRAACSDQGARSPQV